MNSIGVVVTLYNKEETIERALESIERQRCVPAEIIIVNDGSTDASLDRARRFGRGKSKYIIIDQKNMGVSVARNNGINASKSNYVAMLDADDVWNCNHVLAISRMVEKFPEAGMYVASSKKVLGIHEILEPIAACGVDGSYAVRGTEFYKKYSDQPRVLHTSAVCLNKHKTRHTGFFPEGAIRSQDIYLWLKIGQECDVIFNDVVTSFQLMDNSGLGRRAGVVPFYISNLLNDLSYFDESHHPYLEKILSRGAATSCLASLSSGCDITSDLGVALSKTLPTTSKIYTLLSYWPYKTTLSSMARYILRIKERYNNVCH